MRRDYRLEDLLNDHPKLHKDGAGNKVSWQLSTEVLHFIDRYVNESHKTLETGVGVSTILFAMKKTSHICIVPDIQEVEGVKEYCRQHQISTEKITFHLDRSENILPHLELYQLDLVLIDGRHAFPTPFIDWYYSTAALKIGGILIVDDTELWTGQILRKFLLLEPEWKLEADFPPRATIFTKVKEDSHSKEWTEQPYVVHASYRIRNSKMRRALELLRRGKLLTLGRKIIQEIAG